MPTTVASAARRPASASRTAFPKTSAVSFQCFAPFPGAGQRIPRPAKASMESVRTGRLSVNRRRARHRNRGRRGRGRRPRRRPPFAPRHPGLILLDRNAKHGMETSSRNSGVVHAGIYYPEGSLKARLCVEGRRRVSELCRSHDIPHAKTGKIVTATRAEELPALEAIEKSAAANGVVLTRLSEIEVTLWSPACARSAGSGRPSPDRRRPRPDGPLSPARVAGGAVPAGVRPSSGSSRPRAAIASLSTGRPASNR